MRTALLRPLRLKDFRRVWFGELVATLGATFQTVLTAVLVLRLSGSGLALGLTLLLGGLPRTVFTLLGGSLGDRLSPRAVMLVSYAARAVILAALGAVAVTGELELWHLYAARFLYGIADAVFAPSVSAMIPRVVPKEQLAAANSLHRTVLGAGVVVGNAAAGVLIAVAGTTQSMFIIAVAFVAAAVNLAAVSVAPIAKAAGAKTGILRSTADGARYLWSGRTSRAVLLLTAALTLFVAGPLNVGLPALGELRFSSATAIGVLFAAYGAGSIAGSLLPGVLGDRIRRTGIWLVLLGAAFGGSVLLLAFAGTPLWAALAVVPMGAAGAAFNVVALSVIQAETDPAYMGRVMSWYSVSGYGVNPLSNVMTGALADLSIGAMFAVCGGVALAISAVALGTPSLNRLRAPVPEPDPTAGPADRPRAAPAVAEDRAGHGS